MTLNALMQKLRAKSARHKNVSIEAIKIVHNISHDKKLGESISFEKQLEWIRDSIKINKRSYILDKLESIVNKFESLKLTWLDNTEESVIMNDYFSVKFKIAVNGVMEECYVTLNTENKPCPELVKHLNNANFSMLVEHLKALLSLESISSDKKIRTKMLTSLLALEVDILSISKLQMQNNISNIQKYVHSTPLGIAVPRIGGLPLKLIYFIGPFDLISLGKQSQNATMETIISKDLGSSLLISIEASNPLSPNRLQLLPIMLSYRLSDGKSMPTFSGLVNSNSSLLPARFVVILSKPMVMSCTRYQQLPGGGELTFPNAKSMSLLLYEQEFGSEQLWDRRINITIPGQRHRYYVTDSNYCNLVGTLVSRIPFTHPTQLPTIVGQIRLQAFFNSIVGSVVRKQKGQKNERGRIGDEGKDVDDKSEVYTFDVTILSLFQIVVAFCHPVILRLVTVDLELTEQLTVNCKLSYGGQHDPNIIFPTNEYACKVMQRCFSIPILVRSIVKKLTQPVSNMDIYAGANLKFILPPPTLPKAKKSILACGAKASSAASNVKEEVSHDRLIYNLVQLPTQQQQTIAANPTPPNITPNTLLRYPMGELPLRHHEIKMESQNSTSVVSGGGIDSRLDFINLDLMHKVAAFNTSKQDFLKQDKVLSNPMLASLLDQPASSQALATTTGGQVHPTSAMATAGPTRMSSSPIQSKKKKVPTATLR